MVNNSTVAHEWAHQLRDSRDGSNFYFRGSKIYSYGPHYVAGDIKTNRKGKKIYVVNSMRYSSTTAKHLCLVRDAIPVGDLMIESEKCTCPSYYGENDRYYGWNNAVEVVAEYIKKILVAIEKQKRARFADYSHNIKTYVFNIVKWVQFWEMETRKYWGKNTTAVSKYFIKNIKRYGIREEYIEAAANIMKVIADKGWLKDKDFKASVVQISHFASAEVNAAIEKAREKAAKALEEKRRAMLKAFHEKLADWRAFKSSSAPHCNDAFLRYNKDCSMVQTSKGINLSINECKRLWGVIKAFHNGENFKHDIVSDSNGHKWAFSSFKNDILTAGCHSIAYIEIEDMAKTLGFIQ